ncbi:hypothetical protein ACQKJG_17855 [Priestia megaterium]|uniref:hypothetical protein n=1 Tax=Priestia megaterium TaxID=1404 RepID=UPI003D0837C8
MSETKYICTHCMHKQDTTDLGQCEECGYENLVLKEDFVDYMHKKITDECRKVLDTSYVGKPQRALTFVSEAPLEYIEVTIKLNPEDSHDN